MIDWESFYNSFRRPNFIPGYEIQNRLGGGAFGDVYKARKQSIGKSYAIKFLKVDDDAQREAVERELEAVRHFAAIDHPNLVTIEDQGTVVGIPFLIMGYAGEDTLARRLKGGRLDRETALAIFLQVCRGVQALHERRLVHFDLKPSNVFLKGDVARIGDYGLSKLMTDGRMTLSFGRGTPQYMAPEILRNRADHRADIYSLGVMLYECTTGSLPFSGAAAGGLVLREEDVPPFFPPDYPVRLRAVTEHCLRLAPEDRYQQMSELVADIESLVRPGGVPEEPVEEPDFDRAAVASGGRSTVLDLARGAAAVARGVWDGLRGVEGGAEHLPSEESGAAPVAARDARSRARGVLAALPRREDELDLELALEGLAVEAAVPAIMATVPVPPRVEGGITGSLLSTSVIVLEVMASLAAGLTRGVWVVFRSFGERWLASSGRFSTKLARWAFFLVAMTAFGALAMTLGLFFLEASAPGMVYE